MCVDIVIVSRVNSCHPALSQSYKATPEVAEDHDTANQAPAAACSFCRNCISHRDVNRRARQATALSTRPAVTISSQDLHVALTSLSVCPARADHPGS